MKQSKNIADKMFSLYWGLNTNEIESFRMICNRLPWRFNLGPTNIRTKDTYTMQLFMRSTVIIKIII